MSVCQILGHLLYKSKSERHVMLQQEQVNTDAEVSLFPKERYRVRKGFTGNVIFKVRPGDVQKIDLGGRLGRLVKGLPGTVTSIRCIQIRAWQIKFPGKSQVCEECAGHGREWPELQLLETPATSLKWKSLRRYSCTLW